MLRGKAARRPLQLLAAEREAAAEGGRMHRRLPGAGVVGDEMANAPQGVRFRMPQSRAHETVPRLDVDVERGRIHLAETVVEQARPGMGLVRRLVVGEARVAVD